MPVSAAKVDKYRGLRWQKMDSNCAEPTSCSQSRSVGKDEGMRARKYGEDGIPQLASSESRNQPEGSEFRSAEQPDGLNDFSMPS